MSRARFSNLSSYIKRCFSKSSQGPPSVCTSDLPDEISVPMSSHIHINYNAIDARYGVHPFEISKINNSNDLVGHDSAFELTGTTARQTEPTSNSDDESTSAIANSNVNTVEMYDNSLYDSMWRIRIDVNTEKTTGRTNDVTNHILPMNRKHLNQNSYIDWVPDSVRNGRYTDDTGKTRYEGTKSIPFSISTRSIKSKNKEFRYCKASLLSTAFDFNHPETSIIESYDDYGNWKLVLDPNRSENIKQVLENVLDDKTKEKLNQLSHNTLNERYRLDRITWNDNGWKHDDEKENNDPKLNKDGLIGGKSFASVTGVDTSWVWKRVETNEQ
ncbi:uncharacterized protein L201_000447 [Kwoniella dendrophila CBS 6074]|uniref:Uncharacterized protein n=1 Tax=Kwoniella dendrophila CBS 6074 TaxID=1295534 RepID=A0AAX4JL25_9TREE